MHGVPGTLYYCFGAIQLRAYNTVGLRGKWMKEITTFTVVVIVLNSYARKQPLLLLLL